MTSVAPIDLITRAQRGSPEACGELYNCYYQDIYRYLFYRTGDPHHAEDLTSEVFIKMVRALPGYQIQTTPFRAWLFQIARNLAIDHHRRAAARPTVALDENLGSQEVRVDRAVEAHLSSENLSKCLARLEESQRDVLVLRFIDGISIAETARILHKTEDAIKGLQRRALLTLRSVLNHQEENHD
jgi:RNA polymerase sigma-70 factor (ECF subfamily)